MVPEGPRGLAAWMLRDGTVGGKAPLNLGHEVALQVRCWEQLQSGLPLWGPGVCPAQRRLHAQPCRLRCPLKLHFALFWQGIQPMGDNKAASLLLTRGENPGG